MGSLCNSSSWFTITLQNTGPIPSSTNPHFQIPCCVLIPLFPTNRQLIVGKRSFFTAFWFIKWCRQGKVCLNRATGSTSFKPQALGRFRRQTGSSHRSTTLILASVTRFHTISNLISTFRCLYSYSPFDVTTYYHVPFYEAAPWFFWGFHWVIWAAYELPVEELCSSCAKFAKALHSSSSTSAPQSVRKTATGKSNLR